MVANTHKRDTAISPEEFAGLMSFLDCPQILLEKKIAVAVSGGGDSLALSLLLADWAKDKNITLHAITVDHGLRPEAKAEAKYVSSVLKPLGVRHKILTWEGQKPTAGIQEAARNARYQLMADYCHKQKIKFLFIAHHGQDQLETILFRMAKGSGLDGLAGMKKCQELDNDLTLLRPLLAVSHQCLLNTLISRKVEWIEDPSNENNRYARVRIRNINDILEKEGLTPARLLSLTSRINNSTKLIDYLIEDKYRNITIIKETKRIVIKYNELLSIPIEGKARVLKSIIHDLHPLKKYPARLEDIERLALRLDDKFKGSTLGKCVFRKKKDQLFIDVENS